MRLLKVNPLHSRDEALVLVEHVEPYIPEYAILSHTWSEEADNEVLFADVQQGNASSKPGFVKLQYAITQAQEDGYEWLWVDTCCIDKSSSAELSEAINSMFTWYQDAEQCYAYLSDVSFEDWKSELQQSRWWERGWTLQELLAPSDIDFFCHDWQQIGTKAQLTDKISAITGIGIAYLNGTTKLESASIARRMSWASRRHTRRPEDIAYCLMGLFSVNMPMLYGEGEKRAFLRLQQEIMRDSDDNTIFAWVDAEHHHEPHGLLADSPSVFAHSGDILQWMNHSSHFAQSPYSMTNKGLRIEVQLARTDAAVLDCRSPLFNTGLVGVHLRQVGTGGQQYVRVKCGALAALAHRGGGSLEVLVPQKVPPAAWMNEDITPVIGSHRPADHFFQVKDESIQNEFQIVEAISVLEFDERDFDMVTYFPWAKTNPLSREGIPLTYEILIPGKHELRKAVRALTAAVRYRRPDGLQFVLLMGTISIQEVGFDLHEVSNDYKLDWAKSKDSFNPLPPGYPREFSHHRVQVDCDSVQQHLGLKISTVSLRFEATSSPKVQPPLNSAVETPSSTAGFDPNEVADTQPKLASAELEEERHSSRRLKWRKKWEKWRIE